MGLFDDIIGGVKEIGGAFSSFNSPAASSAVSSALSYEGQQQTNQANADQAQRQMDFQERMSGTAHQREVADLRAAGLNPILSANAGASTPGGAMATMGSSLGAGVSSGLQAYQVYTNSELTKAQAEQTRASTAKTLADADFVKAQTTGQNIDNDAQGSESPGGQMSTKKARAQSELSNLDIQGRKAMDERSNIQQNTALAKVNTVIRNLDVATARQQADIANDARKLFQTPSGAALLDAYNRGILAAPAMEAVGKALRAVTGR